MITPPEKIAAAGKANVETLLVIVNTAFTSAERLAALNLHTARSLLEATVTNTKAALEIKNPQGLIAFHKDLAAPAVEKAVAYSRSVYEIASQTQEVLNKLFEEKAGELKDNFDAALDAALKQAPAGSDVAIAAVKSAVASANATLENVKKSTKQAVEMAETHVAAATQATLRSLQAAA